MTGMDHTDHDGKDIGFPLNSQSQHSPSPSEGSANLMIQGYNEDELEAMLTNKILGPVTDEMRHLQHQFISEFILADTNTTTLVELDVILNSWAEIMDKYFFNGLLTQAQSGRLVTVRSYDSTSEPIKGLVMSDPKNGHLPQQFDIEICCASGRRKQSKQALLNMLIHELCDAFLGLTYNDCSDTTAEGQLVLYGEGIENNTGYERLWEFYQDNVSRHMGLWHPVLGFMAPYTHSPADSSSMWLSCTRAYVTLTKKLPWLSRAWGGQGKKRGGQERSRNGKGRRVPVRDIVRDVLWLNFFDEWKSFVKAQVPEAEEYFWLAVVVVVVSHMVLGAIIICALLAQQAKRLGPRR
ncbi:hypothetical protein F5Y16DRAFT_303457 [Xylariaceae sp. FL0255]|nr:hypothetical protein F5Y16DRAFT_303457 [Xylariaceae sp. FL0255]